MVKLMLFFIFIPRSLRTAWSFASWWTRSAPAPCQSSRPPARPSSWWRTSARSRRRSRSTACRMRRSSRRPICSRPGTSRRWDKFYLRTYMRVGGGAQSSRRWARPSSWWRTSAPSRRRSRSMACRMRRSSRPPICLRPGRSRRWELQLIY